MTPRNLLQLYKITTILLPLKVRVLIHLHIQTSYYIRREFVKVRHQTKLQVKQKFCLSIGQKQFTKYIIF
jgi:hypothetical protein